MAVCTYTIQNPLMEVAVFYTLLYTCLRESKLISFKLGQHHSRGFHSVKRKDNITRKVSVPQDAQEERINAYLKDWGGEQNPDPALFLSRYGNTLHLKDIYRIAEHMQPMQPGQFTGQ